MTPIVHQYVKLSGIFALHRRESPRVIQLMLECYHRLDVKNSSGTVSGIV